jgi:hypothetical protein
LSKCSKMILLEIMIWVRVGKEEKEIKCNKKMMIFLETSHMVQILYKVQNCIQKDAIIMITVIREGEVDQNVWWFLSSSNLILNLKKIYITEIKINIMSNNKANRNFKMSWGIII